MKRQTISVHDHERFLTELHGGPSFDFDDDLSELLDRPPARRREAEAERVLRILDELEVNSPERRAF